jgi:hypothetical protein
MIIALLWTPVAQAQDLEWVTTGDFQVGTSWDLEAECPTGETAIAGTASYFGTDGRPPSGAMVGSIPTAGSTGWGGSWAQVLGAAPGSDSEARIAVSALCAEPAHLPCLHHVVDESAPVPAAQADHVALCPTGTYLVGGGASLFGDADGVVLRASAPTGLLWAVGYRAIAEVMDPGAHDDWGIRIEAWCAEPAAAASTGMVYGGAMSPAVSWSGPAYGFTYTTVAEAHTKNSACAAPLTPGMYTQAPEAVASMGWQPDGEWGIQSHSFQGPADPSPGTTSMREICASDLGAFSDDLRSCEPERGEGPGVFQMDIPAIGAEVLIGVIDGASGVVIIPGEGPVPVPGGYLPWQQAAAATRVAIVTVDGDPAEVAAVLAQTFEAEETPWSEHTDLVQTPGLEGVAIVTPRDEQAAVDWLQDSRSEAFAGHPGVVLLLLQEDGDALASVQAWR